VAKNKITVSKGKRIGMLSLMASFSKEFPEISNACMFALTKEKLTASKIDIKNASGNVVRFVKKVPELHVLKNDKTAVAFIAGTAQYLIENSIGSVTIRDLEQIKTISEEILKGVDNTVVDDSHKLINALI